MIGVYLAIGFVVALFVAAAILWIVRNNESYDDLLPPEKQGPEPPREDVLAFAKKRGFSVSTFAAQGGPQFYANSEPCASMAAEAFSMVEAQDLSVAELVVSPFTLKRIEDWGVEVLDLDPVTLWGAAVVSDGELPDDVMLTVPDIDPKEIPDVEADVVGVGYVIWDIEGGIVADTFR